MKKLQKLIIAAVALPATMLFASPVQVHEVGALPSGCQVLGEIKVGDIAGGHRVRGDVMENARKEATTLGGNYVLVDVKRVNNPKQGVYYWGWGTVGLCK